jgi:hypothetical protein
MHDCSREFAGPNWALKGHPALSQGNHRDPVHSDQMVLVMIRRGGWSGRAKLSGGQESQTKHQGTVRLPPQRATTKAARWEATGPNKELLSQQFSKKETELEVALAGSTVGQKTARQRKQQLKEGKTLSLCSNLEVAEGVMSGVMRSLMNENQKSQSQVHVTALWCRRVKHGKRGLNSRL